MVRHLAYEQIVLHIAYATPRLFFVTESAQYIGIDTAESRLVHIADYDSSEDELSLRLSMLWR